MAAPIVLLAFFAQDYGCGSSNPAALSANPATLSFGGVIAGTSSAEMTVAISNTGATPSGTIDTAINGDATGQFTISAAASPVPPAR